MELIVKPYKLQFWQAGGDTWGSESSFPGTQYLPHGTWIWALKVAGARGKYHLDGHIEEAEAHEQAERIVQEQEAFVLASRPMRILGTKEQAKIAIARLGRRGPEMRGE